VVMFAITASAFGEVDRWVWRQCVQNPILTDVAKAVTDLGSMSVLMPGAVVAGAALWWRYRSVLLAVVPWVALQINSSFVAVLKRTFDVVRPPQENWLAGAAGGSLPSGHVANTTALLVAVAVVVFVHETSSTARRTSVVMASSGIVIMAWTRLALNVHWLSDVLAGAIVGIVISAATALVAIAIKSRRENPLQTRDRLAS
jgi:membrane-associated phospholipid phosphatase